MKVLRATVVAIAAGSLGGLLHAELVDGINAIAHDSVVTYREVERYALPARQQLARQYSTRSDMFEKEFSRIRSQSLETLLERQLILRDFETAGYSLPESVIEDAVQEEIDRYGGRTKLTKTLQADGMTFEKFRRQIRDQFIVRVLRSKNVQQEIIISPHKIETYYLAHQDDYKLEDEIKLRMIVLRVPSESEVPAVRQMAQEILGKIKAGAAFSEMASVYSQGLQRNQGGDWGWVERKTLSAGLAAIAFAMKPGDHSGVISRAGTQTDFWFCEYDNAGKPTLARHFVVDPESKLKKESLVEERTFQNAGDAASLPPPEEFYLMLVEEKRTAHVKPLSDVQEEIERTLLAQEQARLQKQYVNRLKKKTYVRYF